MAESTGDLQSLQRRRDELIARGEIATLEQEIPGLERWAEGLEQSGRLVEETGRWVGNDPSRFDPSYYGRRTTAIDQAGDRALGQDRLLFQSEYDLSRIRGFARVLCNEVAPAIAVLRSLTNYVIGIRWMYEAKSDTDVALADAANLFLQRWLKFNHWVGKRDRETYIRTKRDGECLIKLQPLEGGFSRIRFCEPSWITEPSQTRDLDDWIGNQFGIPDVPLSWTFGVVTPHDDFETIYGYHLVRDTAGTDWDFIPASHATHFKAVTDSNVKRGVSEYHPVYELLRNGEKVFSRTATGAIVQASIAGVKQAPPGARESQISGINRIGDRAQAIEGGTRQIDQSKFGPGTILTMSSGLEWVHGPMGSQRNPALVLAGQASLRLAGARWNMPEWIISGDASNNNFSSTLVAESPFVKAAESEQHTFKCDVEGMLWKVFHIAWQSGVFGSVDWDQFTESVQIQISPPSVQTRDVNKLVNETNQLLNGGVMSLQTAAERHNLDWEIEQQRMAAEIEVGAAAARDVGLDNEDI